MENSRKGRNLRSVALFLAMLIITPLLILGCSCAKTAQNNTVYNDSAHTSARRDSVNQRQIHFHDTKQHDSVFKHDSVLVYINGDTVMVYSQPQLDEREQYYEKMLEMNNGQKVLTGGTISLQSEGHPCDFRNVEIKVLKD